MNSKARAFRRKRDYIASKPNTLIKVFDRLFAEHGDHVYNHINAGTNINLSCNPNVTWDFIKNHLKINWCKYSISGNPNITWNIIKETLGYWNWKGVSCNPNITWNIIKNNFLLPWNMAAIIDENPHVTWDEVGDYVIAAQNTEPFKDQQILPMQLTLKDIENNAFLSKFKDVETDIVLTETVELENIDILPNNAVVAKIGKKIISSAPRLFPLFLISKNLNITWQFIKKHGITRPFYWAAILNHMKFTAADLCEFFEAFLSNQLRCQGPGTGRQIVPLKCIEHLLSNPNITWGIITETMSKIKWNWSDIAHSNPNITVYVFEQLLQMRLQEERTELIQNYLSNPNVTYKFICANQLNTLAHITTFARNDFLWNDTVYARSIKEDIENRIAAIKSVLNAAVGTAFDSVLRYIDYI